MRSSDLRAAANRLCGGSPTRERASVRSTTGASERDVSVLLSLILSQASERRSEIACIIFLPLSLPSASYWGRARSRPTLV